MPLIVNTNLAALNARRQLISSGQQLDEAAERLASGRLINSARDDAAGLSISNRMTSQIRGLSQAIRNANDGISLIQVAEGALSESTNVLQRIRELAVQSTNGLYAETDRRTLDAEVQQLVAELDRIATSTTFNGQSILDGSIKTLDLQVGDVAEQNITLSIAKLDSASLGLSSNTGALLGHTMSISNAGHLAFALEDGDVLINGRSIGAFTTDNTLGHLLDAINDEVPGVTASSIVTIEGNKVGTGVLEDGQTLSLKAFSTEGTELSLAITNTASLQELADEITAQSGGRFTASLNDEGVLTILAEGFASMTLADSTNGIATGINLGVLGGTADEQAVINALQDYWLVEAETLIQTHFGLSVSNVDLDLELYTDSTSSTVASVSWEHVNGVADFGQNLSLNINMHYFNSGTLPNGGNYPLYTDRVIAHELVHAVMAVQMDMEQLPGWFTEGIPEFIHGADERVVGDIYTGGAVDNVKVNALALKTTAGSPADSAGYTAGYLAVRMLHDNIVAQTGGASGIDDLLATLSAQGVNTDLDAAITALGINWGGGNTSLAGFEAHFAAQVNSYVNGTYLGPGGGGLTFSSLDLDNTDTGSIAGNDVDTGNPVYTADSILPNTANSGPANFSLVIPDEFSSGNAQIAAKLMLDSERGEVIRVARGTTGRLRDLYHLGFQEMEKTSEIKGVGLSDPDTAWEAGTITINNVVIDHQDTDSLAGKLAAINAATSSTGVRAEAYSAGMLDLSNFNFTQWATLAGNPDFNLNGVELTGIVNATSIQEIADVFNNVSDKTGVTARTRGTSILLEGAGPIAFSNPSTANTAAAFGFSNYGNASFLASYDDVSGSDPAAFSAGVLSEAGIKLIAIDGGPIQLALDDPPAGTLGLMAINSLNEGTYGSSMNKISVATGEQAQRAIVAVDNALQSVNENRSNLGAVQNRLSFVIANLGNIVENTAAARSRIVDADFAAESSQLSRAQIMQQASSAMLAQANLRPQQILQLLQ